jgi:hypothetical protein
MAGAAAAQDRTQSTQPQPEGKVTATCADSPKGLVARPSKPKGTEQDAKTPQR